MVSGFDTTTVRKSRLKTGLKPAGLRVRLQLLVPLTDFP